MYKIVEALERALSMPYPAGAYTLGRVVAEHWGGFSVLETEDYDFDLFAYAEEGLASLFLLDEVEPMIDAVWETDPARFVSSPRSALLEAVWNGARYRVLVGPVGDRGSRRWYVAGDSRAATEALFAAVCTWTSRGKGNVQVFQSGYFEREPRLAQAVESASLSDLILEPGVLEELKRACLGFFGAKETYETCGVPWRRGVLLTGPPGNGKTHAIRAIVREAGKPCLYVRNFGDPGEEASGVATLFERARQVAPCVIVMEDLDSLVKPDCLSALLNELDGLAPNPGVLTVATTNHPEKLDPALVQRPSRFDRKVAFGLPRAGLRREFLLRLTSTWPEGGRLDEPTLNELVVGTDGFTFAYLKELLMGSLTAWFYTGRERPMREVLSEELATLRRQVGSPLA